MGCGVVALESSGHQVWVGGVVLLESFRHWCKVVLIWDISKGSVLITTRTIKVTYRVYIIVIHGIECTI